MLLPLCHAFPIESDPVLINTYLHSSAPIEFIVAFLKILMVLYFIFKAKGKDRLEHETSFYLDQY